MKGRIGVYYVPRPDETGRGTWHDFHFYLVRENGPKRFSKRLQGDGKLLRIVPLPTKFEEYDLGDKPGDQYELGYIGVLEQTQQRSLGVTEHYEPKKQVPPASPGTRRAPGLGSFLEAVVTEELERRGMRTIKTSKPFENYKGPSKARLGQLARAGLSPDTEYAIGFWRSRMYDNAKVRPFTRWQVFLQRANTAFQR